MMTINSVRAFAPLWAKQIQPGLVTAGFNVGEKNLARAGKEVCYGAMESARLGYVVGPGGNWSARVRMAIQPRDIASRIENPETLINLLQTSLFMDKENVLTENFRRVSGAPADIEQAFSENSAILKNGKLVFFFGPEYGNSLKTVETYNLLSALDARGLMVIKGTGIRAGELLPANNAVFDITSGQQIQLATDVAVKPSCEWPFHLAVMRSRPGDVNAICHAHPIATTAFATTGVKLQPFTPDVVALLKLGSPMPIIPYVFPASEALAQAINGPISQGFNEVLMAKHGLVTVAPNMTLAFDRTDLIEKSAQYLLHLMTIYTGLGRKFPDVPMEEYALNEAQCGELLGSGFERLRQQMADQK